MTPRLFKPENNTKAEEFKEFLPVNVTCSFRSLAPAIAQCEDKYLLPILGETLFSRLAAYYEGGTHDNELLEALLKRSQYAVVRLAYWQDYDLLSVSMSDKGAADNAGEGRLYKYQADALKKALKNGGVLPKSSADDWRNGTLEERLKHALVKGIGDYLEADLDEAAQQYDNPVKIIEGPLMDAMNTVGELFGSGKMFLPQVVKTARTMKKAVSILQPLIEASRSEGAQKAGKVLLATVKGDVHDIGKNIVSVILACNNYDIIDLGVMVPTETIVDRAIEEKVDIIGLSGLITPSLEEMVNVARALEERGADIPIMIGGATTSELHTALKIAPVYHGPVLWMKDASQNVIASARLLNPDTRAELTDELDKKYAELRSEKGEGESSMVSLEEARKRKPNYFD